MIQCKNCNEFFDSKTNFCTVCGSKIVEAKAPRSSLDQIIAFYIISIVFIGLSSFVYEKNEDNLRVELLIELLFVIIVLSFSFFDWKNILALYRLPKINKWRFIVYILLTIINSFIVYFITESINSYINYGSINYYESYLYTSFPLFWSFLFIALLPPIFEELGFRGFLFNKLNKIVSKRSTIIATTFLFSLIHFSFISFIWIFPFGVFLGYLRSKYSSLLLPMVIHFIHNFMILCIDYFLFSSL